MKRREFIVGAAAVVAAPSLPPVTARKMTVPLAVLNHQSEKVLLYAKMYGAGERRLQELRDSFQRKPLAEVDMVFAEERIIGYDTSHDDSE